MDLRTGRYMSEGNDQEQGQGKKRLSLRSSVKRDVGQTVDAGSIRQSFSHGRTKVVQVEVRKKRSAAGNKEKQTNSIRKLGTKKTSAGSTSKRSLTAAELAIRQRVLEEQKQELHRRNLERQEQEQISILSEAEKARKQKEEKEALAKALLEVEKATQEKKEETVAEETFKKIVKVKKIKTTSALPLRRVKVSDFPIPGEITLAPEPAPMEPLAKRAILPEKPVVSESVKNGESVSGKISVKNSSESVLNVKTWFFSAR